MSRFEAQPVLAGPIVRRVDEGEAAIWIALAVPRALELEVFDDRTGDRVADGTAAPLAIGDHLHVGVVRARGDIAWGGRYRYRLAGIDTDDLAYGGGMPAFATPPPALDDLRILHGSCRVPHGEGRDALAAVDDILAARATAGDRPHHLLLSGDQVYVNNIAPEILPHLTALGDELLGWRETFPDRGDHPSDFPPGTREALVRERGGLLEYGDDSHLVGFGEMCALYLMSLGTAAWPEELPWTRRGLRMRSFKSTLPQVMRALANIPVLTIFDDHEVTDDWNLTLHWVDSVLGKPLGRRIVSNALCAYALFQGWGNHPRAFDAGPGRELLDALAGWRGDPATATRLEHLVGLPEPDALRARTPPALGGDPTAVSWSYRYPGPCYDLVVPDQRMCRAFPGDSPLDPPALMSDDAIAAQIGGAPSRHPIVFVMSSSALVPLPKPWYLRAFVWLSQHVAAWRHHRDPHYADVYGPDRGDAWRVPSRSFARLCDALCEASPSGTVIALAGDIHIGSAARVGYRNGERRLELIQLTSSPLRKEHGGTRWAHRMGYRVFGPPPRQSLPPAGGDRGELAIEWLAGDRRQLLGVNHVSEVRVVGGEVISDAWWGEPAEVRNRFRIVL